MILVFFGSKTFRLYKYDIWWDYVITIIEYLKNLRNHKELSLIAFIEISIKLLQKNKYTFDRVFAVIQLDLPISLTE